MIGTILMGIVAMIIEYKRQKLQKELELRKLENHSLKMVLANEGLIPKKFVSSANSVKDTIVEVKE